MIEILKEELLKMKSWFINKEVPMFDKICFGFLLVVIGCMVAFVLFGLISVLFIKPITFLFGAGIVFFMFSVVYLIIKYD